MKKIISTLAILLGLSTVAHAGPLPEPAPKLTRLAYARLPGGLYMLRSLPLFDVNPAGGVPIVGGGGGVSTSGTNTWTGTNTFTDSTFFLADDGDATKKLQFQLSGITTGNTITPFTFAGTTAAPTISIPNGVVGTPSLQFANSATSGLWSRAANAIDFSANGLFAGEISVTSNGWQLPSTAPLCWSSIATAGAGCDTLLFRKAPATAQIGKDLNGAAINQTFTACNGITGTDIIGCNLALGPGTGTGAGAGAAVSLQRTLITTTGTTAQTRTDAFTPCESKIISNTTGTPTVLANVVLASGSAGGARVTVAVTCTNGTEFAGSTVTSFQGFANKAGTITLGTATTQAEANGASTGGTLNCTVAPTWVANGNSVDIKVTPVITGAATTTTAFLNVENLGAGAVVCK